ncbi:hypothetical protein BT93_I1092 [Corymbia citriodora subsp. variegata]|nr:hypothetical protein BT93_I1092 [Corymbia citriodora subsp. variegata]
MRSSNAQAADQSRSLHELCSMIAHIMELPPPPTAFPVAASASRRPRLATASTAQVSPAALAPLFVGIPLALMLVGSVTFVIGLILMPWVVLLVSCFYAAGMVSALSELAGRYCAPSLRCKTRPMRWLLYRSF